MEVVGVETHTNNER